MTSDQELPLFLATDLVTGGVEEGDVGDAGELPDMTFDGCKGLGPVARAKTG